MKLHQAEKDYELSVTSSTRLSEMNKELQKSLMFSNEKYYSLERQKAALEFEAASLKDSANNDNEGLTSAVDFLRREITEIETKLEASIEELKLARLDKIEVETALNGEILARDKAIEDLELELEDAADSEEAMGEELQVLKNFVKKSYSQIAGVSELHLLSEEEEEAQQAAREAIRQERADKQAERHAMFQIADTYTK